jgi:thiol:disulfide interchange protein
MNRIIRWLVCVFAPLTLLLSVAAAPAQLKELGDGGPGPVKALHLTAELVSLAPAVAPGGTVQLGLVITLDENWHVYWINAGDSGNPPKITWTLPAGVTVGPMQFPAPSRLPLGPLMDFGYEDEVAFPIALSVAPGVAPGPIHLDAKVNWLVCREVCIPGKAHMGIDLKVAPGAPPGELVGAVGQALKTLPGPPPAAMKFSVLGGKTDFVLTLVSGKPQQDAEFFPFDPDQIQNAADQRLQGLSDGIRVWVRRSEDPDHPGTYAKIPTHLHGILKLSETEAYEVDAPVVPGEMAQLMPPVPTAPGGKLTIISAIGLAFLGGIILNLMPCVFPVLFLKGLALINSSGQERRHLRSHGLVYTLGILVSFWIIVGILLILRSGGSQAGWGFQLQSPAFVAILASLLFFFALSLAGQFDLGLSLTSAGGELAKKEGFTGSFFTGILATVVATPCTAPLMGAAIGFALAQPPWVTFSIFTALGLGLAMPYLVLTLQPAWTRLLPRPGAWMEVLKQVTAVPLFGTVIWLAWVFGSLYSGAPGSGSNHIARLLWCFLVLAIAGWTLGRWPARWTSSIVAIVLCLAAISIPLTEPRKDALTWQPYSQATLDQARKDGHPVFIDFTAAWCLSCQVNEKVVLQSKDVVQALADHKFVMLRADWTEYDPEITKELQSIGRSGVPTYVIYPAKLDSPADVLPELLTKSIVLDGIASDTK